MNRLASLGIAGLQPHASLAKYTAARLGGAADWLYVARHSNDDLLNVVRAAWEDQMPIRIFGGGSNILISDRGVRGLVVINHVANIEFGNWHGGRKVAATAGTGLLRLARECAAQGIAGLEWAVGIPGTVGGAVVNNAGAHNADMAACVADVVIYDADRGPQMYTNSDMRYSYRHSALKAREDNRFLVLLATFALRYDTPDAIDRRMDEFTVYRKRTQPAGASLGSIFKNPTGDYAGRLIEAAGLKGYRIGAIEISKKHANFFVNTGKATASDYYALICYVRDTVFRIHGIELELEVELVGDWTG